MSREKEVERETWLYAAEMMEAPGRHIPEYDGGWDNKVAAAMAKHFKYMAWLVNQHKED